MPVLGVRSRRAIAIIALTAIAGCSTSQSRSSVTTTTPSTAPELASPTAGAQVVMSALQLDLQALGYDPGQVSGQFTTATTDALIKFQQAASTPVTERGVLGPATAAALQARLGGSSEAVQALQSALTDVGLFTGMINGQYGPETTDAVKALQRRAQIAVDGLFGPATAAALDRLYATQVPEPPTSAPSPTTTVTGSTTSTTGGTSLLKLGSTGPAVTALQHRLTALGYRPGSVDGAYGADTAGAVLAFQKREGLARDGDAGPAVLAALGDPHGAGPRSGGPVPRIEVDIARQIAFIMLPSQSVITLNVSTGNGETYKVPGGGTDVAYTPVGSFTVLRKIAGDEVAPLGTLHNPVYFFRGWAVHGSSSVPAYPASHGCVRISNADADWLFPLIAVGTTVVLYDTTGHSPGPDGLPANAAPGF